MEHGITTDDRDPFRERVRYLVQPRKDEKRQDRDREKRRKKGNAAHFAEVRKKQRDRDVLAAQLEVLRTREPGDPMYDNVYRAMFNKYGAAFLALDD